MAIEISRRCPLLVDLEIDQSGSMQDPLPGVPGVTKATFVADTVNGLIDAFYAKCDKGEEIYDYTFFRVRQFSSTVGSAYAGALAGKDIVPISELAVNVFQTEPRQEPVIANGRVVGMQDKEWKIWVPPVSGGGTDMLGSFREGVSAMQAWCQNHMECHPPLYFVLTDGEVTDSGLTQLGNQLKDIKTNHGNVLVMVCHISGNPVAQPIAFPASRENLADEYAKTLFDLASEIPDDMVELARSLGFSNTQKGSKAYICNAKAYEIAQFVQFGTQKALASLR